MMRIFLLGLLLSTTVYARVMTIHTEYMAQQFDTPAEETVLEAIIRAAPFIEGAEHIVIEISSPMSWKEEGTVFELAPREYYRVLSEHEWQDLYFLITTLANRSLISMGLSRGEIEAAGNRLAGLHPLFFLKAIFTNEELKVNMRLLRNKGIVWQQFSHDFSQSLAREYAIGNFCEEYVRDFSQATGIDSARIMPFIHQGAWHQFLDTLVTIVPRKGDYGRYDY